MTGQPQLLAEILAEQRSTAVTDFAHWHDRNKASTARYRTLLPLSLPREGEQYAFEVDLDKCTGCKACVTACHALNGLDEHEAWRETGLLVSTDWREPYQQVVTTACHHCADPGCLNGCPVLAYEKDPVTGIVRHLDDQCIGCQYCVMKCPYEVPKYSASRGIVRKCDMCSSRLADGEPPACVQACPNEAIRITTVTKSSLLTDYRRDARNFLPASPNPRMTVPTTAYVTQRPRPATVQAVDHETLRPQPAHTPLVIMLVFSQLATGLWACSWAQHSRWQAAAALLTFGVALAASVFHLGRPAGAWRFFLGLKRSWLSREIAAFGIYAASGIAYTVTLWQGGPIHWLASLTMASGLTAIFCSAMVYHDTQRDFWHLKYTLPKFLLTAVRLGTGATILAGIIVGEAAHAGLLALLTAATLAKFAVDSRVLNHALREDYSPLHKTAILLTDTYGLIRRIRITCSLLGGIVLPVTIALTKPSLTLGVVAFCLSLASELIERWQFFTCVQSVTMPGVRHGH